MVTAKFDFSKSLKKYESIYGVAEGRRLSAKRSDIVCEVGLPENNKMHTFF